MVRETGIDIILAMAMAFVAMTIIGQFCIYIRKQHLKISHLNINMPTIITLHSNSKYKNVRLRFLIDTGCQRSVISDNAIKLMDYEDTGNSIKAFGMEGITNEYSIVRTSINFKRVKVKFRFAVMPSDSGYISKMMDMHGIRIDGIIGSDMMKRYGFLINFATKQLIV